MSTHNQPKGSFNSSVPGRTKRPSSMRGSVVPSAFFDRNRLQFAVRNRDVRVASEVCFRRIFFPFCRNLVLARDYFFSVRVVHRAVLRPGVAGVAHRKMRTIFSAIRIGSFPAMPYCSAITYAVVFVPMANSPIGSVLW